MVPREGNQVKRVTIFDLALIGAEGAGNNPESAIVPKQVKRVISFDLALIGAEGAGNNPESAIIPKQVKQVIR